MKPKNKSISCRLCGCPLNGYLMQGSIYKFACGSRETVEGRRAIGIRPLACEIIESLGGYKPRVDDKGQLEIPFPEVKSKSRKQ